MTELMGQEMELNSALGNAREQGPEREAPAEVWTGSAGQSGVGRQCTRAVAQGPLLLFSIQGESSEN